MASLLHKGREIKAIARWLDNGIPAGHPAPLELLTVLRTSCGDVNRVLPGKIAVVSDHILQQGHYPGTAIEVVLLVSHAADIQLKSRKVKFQRFCQILSGSPAEGVHMVHEAVFSGFGQEVDINSYPVASVYIDRHDHLGLALFRNRLQAIEQVLPECAATMQVRTDAVDHVRILAVTQVES